MYLSYAVTDCIFLRHIQNNQITMDWKSAHTELWSEFITYNKLIKEKSFLFLPPFFVCWETLRSRFSKVITGWMYVLCSWLTNEN